MNPRISAKERNLIKGALRRVFSRSELRKAAIDATLAPDHTDDSRPKVKRWCLCPECKVYTPKSYMECDHAEPIVPVDKALSDMTWDEVIDRIWCELFNLQGKCETCHNAKTKAENKERAANRKRRKQK